MGAALALSTRSDTLQPRCLVIVAPLVLLVVAYGFDRLRADGPTLLALASAAALLAVYVVQLPPLYSTPRSSARELARDLAARVAPSDLVLLSPWWVASSFNRYYRPGTEQIDFPAMERVGATPFDDAARRLGDPAAFEEAKQRITASRAAGRRIWWIADLDFGTCAEPQCEAMIGPDTFFLVGVARTSQLRRYLVQVYGTPTCDTRSYSSGRDESLELCLFTPH
jgi:hypothetical protein